MANRISETAEKEANPVSRYRYTRLLAKGISVLSTVVVVLLLAAASFAAG
ncbi:hypothetical protein [Pseudorhizobium pelagicum]|nr:hypothetical protein [Pseudorhizobium pelagicum]